MATIVWFKRDLRTTDHAPLAEAASGPVVPLYIVEPSLLASPDHDPIHYEFIRQSLHGLRRRLAELGAPLVVRVGEAVEVLEQVRRETGATALYSHQETGNGLSYARDQAVRRWADQSRVEWREWRSGGVVRRLRTRDGWAERWERQMRRPVVPEPEGLVAAPIRPGPIPLGTEVGLEPSREGMQIGGQDAARSTLESFLSGRGRRYRVEMASPNSAFLACSRLSPHLAFGTISGREAYQAALAVEEPSWARTVESFLSRLRWRDHFIQKLESEPEIEHAPFVRHYEGMRPDLPDDDRFAAWTEGQTGYPMVDACVRALRETGYLNFRMRAMLCSFASYQLWLPWQATALWSARQWLDYEPGIHYPQFQMQSGETGINAIRIYNPTKQGLEQDPTGEFIRRWVPELEGVPLEYLHEPWRMPLGTQIRAGCRVGQEYPLPVVENEAAVGLARERLRRYRTAPEAWEQANRVQDRHGSNRNAPRPRRPKPSLQRALDL